MGQAPVRGDGPRNRLSGIKFRSVGPEFPDRTCQTIPRASDPMIAALNLRDRYFGIVAKAVASGMGSTSPLVSGIRLVSQIFP